VGRTDNVVLYMERISRDGELSTSDIVQQQAEIYEVGPAGETEIGEDIDSDGQNEHAKTHIGERQWGTDPNSHEDVPDPSLSIETDFINGSPSRVYNNSAWEGAVERNFALYDIHVDIVRDDTIDLSNEQLASGSEMSLAEYGVLAKSHNSGSYDQYMLVMEKPGLGLGDDVYGGNPPGVDLLGIYTAPMNGASSGVDTYEKRTLGLASNQVVVGTLVSIHEVGHSLHLGKADDGHVPEPAGEIYSGSEADPTREPIVVGTRRVETWSVMRQGWGPQSLHITDGKGYFVFSIEELTTVEENE